MEGEVEARVSSSGYARALNVEGGLARTPFDVRGIEVLAKSGAAPRTDGRGPGPRPRAGALPALTGALPSLRFPGVKIRGRRANILAEPA